MFIASVPMPVFFPLFCVSAFVTGAAICLTAAAPGGVVGQDGIFDQHTRVEKELDKAKTRNYTSRQRSTYKGNRNTFFERHPETSYDKNSLQAGLVEGITTHPERKFEASQYRARTRK